MAKTRHNHFLDTVDELFTDAKNKGVFHLYSEDVNFTGRVLQIEGKKMFHFGTTGYLNLEQDERLKDAAIEAIRKYGTQFALSKTFISSPIYKQLEDNLYKMYGHPTLVAKNSTLCHLAVIPSIIRDEDVVILDHQVHNSVQSACQLLKPRGIPVDMIRHSNLDMLEEKIKEYSSRHKKIWYMIDGIYSMFGDCAPLHEIIQLLDKYPQLNLYVDDVHGMSWAGKNGTGYVLSQIGTLHPKMVLVSTLSKCFGASGAIMVCADHELSRYVKNFGGALSFSAQLEPSGVAAAVASSEIHLSGEIYKMQEELAMRINYCNSLLKETNLPLIAENNCPLFYIGTGLPSSGYALTKAIMNEGFFVNMGIFPAVAVKNTGLRFTISRANELSDIKALIEAIKYHYPRVLEQENKSLNDVRKFFKLPEVAETIVKNNPTEDFKIIHENTIANMDKDEWNRLLGAEGMFDTGGMQIAEETFKNNERKEDNWDFHYLTIKDNQGIPVISTFATVGLWKDDMMVHPSISKQIEEKRKSDPYYLTSKAVSVGSLLTDGSHLYINKEHKQWKAGLMKLLQVLNEIQDQSNAIQIILRDFEDNDPELLEFFTEQGFIKLDIPECSIVENLTWNSETEYLKTLTPRSQRHIKYDVLKYEEYFNVRVNKQPTEAELAHYNQLYLNVKRRNLDINIFDYPEKLFRVMSKNANVEFLELTIKPEFDSRENKLPVAVAFNYLNAGNNYVFLLIGMDYEMRDKFQVYKQTIYQVIKRGREVKADKIFLGFSASMEKKKYGATIVPKVAFVQYKDNYSLEFIGTMNIRREDVATNS